MPGRKIRNEDDARRCLAQAAASSQTRAAWARGHGIDARSLNMWRVILQRPGAEAALPMVELVANLTPASGWRVRCGAFEVEVPAGFDPDDLARLLRVVAAC